MTKVDERGVKSKLSHLSTTKFAQKMTLAVMEIRVCMHDLWAGTHASFSVMCTVYTPKK